MKGPVDMQAAERTAKQSFLAAEILDMGYVPDQFLEFCELKKSSNIDEWTFEELETCIKEFKQVYKPKSSEGSSPLKQSGKEEDKKEPSEERLFNSADVTIVETLKMIRNELDTQLNLKVIVCNPELVNPGFLSSNYFVYVVNTLPPNWIVKRKIEEFVWLREMLSTVFPAVFIPASHQSTKLKPSDKGLYKRQVMYSSFLNSALASPALRNSSYLLSFLKENDLKNVIKHSKKLQRPRDFSLVTSYVGETCLLYTEALEQYEKLQKYLVACEKVLVKVLQKIKKLIVDSVVLSDSVKECAGSVAELVDCHRRIKHLDEAQVFADVEEVLVAWAGYVMRSTKNIYEDLKLPINIFKQELAGLREIVKERESLLVLYRSKEKSNSFKDFFAFFNYQCIAQACSVICSAAEVLRNKMKAGLSKKQEESVQFHLIWGNLVANLASIN